MSKIDKLLDKTKRNGETKKWKMYAFAVIGILVVVGGFIGIMSIINPLIDAYILDSKDAPHIYDFYDAKVGANQTAVYFIGSSIIGDAIYTPEINRILQEKGYNISAYNLAMDGDTPLRRSTQIQNIIDSSPSLIIYGTTYRTINAKNWEGERVILVHDRLNIRNDSLFLYTENEKEDFNTKADFFFKKTYLKSILTYKHSPAIGSWDYFTDPFGLEHRPWRDARKDPESIVKLSQDPTDPWRPIITNESTRYKEALIYNVHTLQDAGIPVIIINMPLHPLFSEQITDESRQNYYDVLNQTGAKWIDLEHMYGDDFFQDSHHSLFSGALEFAPLMADLIIQEMT